MSYQYLEHATDALIEVHAKTLEEAFSVAGVSVVDTTLDMASVQQRDEKIINVRGEDLRYLLFNWLEEVNYVLITEGFAIGSFSLKIQKNEEYEIHAKVFGEAIDLKKHQFKVEIKAPTFHLMEIKQNDEIVLRFLLDL